MAREHPDPLLDIPAGDLPGLAAAESSPFIRNAPDNELELTTMARALDLASGFKLILAKCSVPAERRQLVSALRERIANKNLIEFVVPIETSHLLDYLREHLPENADAVFVSGLEDAISNDEHPELSSFVLNLNASRDSFPAVVCCPLVLWVNDYSLAAIANGAPDFFSVRSGVYYFQETEGFRFPADRALGLLERTGDTSIPAEERRARIEEIHRLLADYEALPEKQRDFLAEARLNTRLGELLQSLSEYAPAVLSYEKGLANFRMVSAVGNSEEARAGVATSLSGIGSIHLSRGEFAEALNNYQESLRIVEELGNRIDAAVLLRQIGRLLYLRAEYEEALARSQGSLQIFEELGSREEVAWSLLQIGHVRLDRGEFGDALEKYQASLRLFEKLGKRDGVASSLHWLGILHQFRGDYGNALANYQQALRIFEDIGDDGGAASLLRQIGIMYQQRGNYDNALAKFKESMEIAQRRGDRQTVAGSLQQIGTVHYLRKEYDDAFNHFQQSMKIFEEVGNRVGVADALCHIGLIDQARGQYGKALAKFVESLRINQEIGDRRGAVFSVTQAGRLAAEAGHLPEAFDFLMLAHSISAQLGRLYSATVATHLKSLRLKWGPENFDPEWKKVTGQEPPSELTDLPQPLASLEIRTNPATSPSSESHKN